MQAVVFDFDGVIAKSMEQHAEAYRQVLAPLGVAVHDREVFLREGARSETILSDLLTVAGHPPAAGVVRRLAEEKQRVFESLGKPGLYQGAAELMEAVLAGGASTAIVSGTRRVNLEALIPDWVERFDALLTQEDYSRDKPHPEPYAAAAKALRREPSDCIAVENAIRGVQSAKAAGYGTVLAICTTLAEEDLVRAEPDAILGDHDALEARLRGLLKDS